MRTTQDLHPLPPRERLLTAVDEAGKSFDRGDQKLGVASLNHALWIALTARPVVDELEARRLYQSIEKAAKVWESDA